jgi:hypothetical protein
MVKEVPAWLVKGVKMRSPRTEKGPNSKLDWNLRDGFATYCLPAFLAHEGNGAAYLYFMRKEEE